MWDLKGAAIGAAGYGYLKGRGHKGFPGVIGEYVAKTDGCFGGGKGSTIAKSR